MFEPILAFIEKNHSYFDAAQSVGSVVNLIGWLLGGTLLFIAWRRGKIRTIAVGPISFEMEEEAVEAIAVASRSSKGGERKVDVPAIRSAVSRAFSPSVHDNLIGKSVLWVDDNPRNNRLGVRALRKLRLSVVEVESTEDALREVSMRKFDLVISDMGRGEDLQAGYRLLRQLRENGETMPFFIFAGSDTPRFREEAARLGAQLSTNNILEVVDNVIDCLGANEKS